MKKIDILNRIAKNKELPKEINYNEDYGELVQYKNFVNYIMYNKDDKYDMYWLIDYDLQGLNDEVEVAKVKKKVRWIDCESIVFYIVADKFLVLANICNKDSYRIKKRWGIHKLYDENEYFFMFYVYI